MISRRRTVTQPSGLARLALVHLEGAPRFGLSRARLLSAAGLSEEQLRDPDARIPLSAVERLWRATTAGSSDALLGLRLGAEVRTRQLGLVGYTLVFSRTLGAALERLTRYSRIVSDALHVELGEDAEAVWVRLDVQPALRALRAAADARLAALVAICRELVGAPIAPLAVQFPYRRPDDVSAYEKFFRAPLEFGALSTALLLMREDLARPVVGSDEALTAYLERLVGQVLHDLGAQRTISDQVRRVLWRQLSDGVPDLSRAARWLGMSPRTLQRRLREENTTFAAVLAEVRRDMAQPLLRDGRLAVSEVAFLLGYEDVTSFQRAFRQWFGVSPRAFRRHAG
jgi:AraC-like DNA-binding protein